MNGANTHQSPATGRSRVQAGVTAGGEFAVEAKSEPTTSLEAPRAIPTAKQINELWGEIVQDRGQPEAIRELHRMSEEFKASEAGSTRDGIVLYQHVQRGIAHWPATPPEILSRLVDERMGHPGDTFGVDVIKYALYNPSLPIEKLEQASKHGSPYVKRYAKYELEARRHVDESVKEYVAAKDAERAATFDARSEAMRRNPAVQALKARFIRIFGRPDTTTEKE